MPLKTSLKFRREELSVCPFSAVL